MKKLMDVYKSHMMKPGKMPMKMKLGKKGAKVASIYKAKKPKMFTYGG